MNSKGLRTWGLIVFATLFIVNESQQKDFFYEEKAEGIKKFKKFLHRSVGHDDFTEHAHRRTRQLIQGLVERFLIYNIIYVIDSSSSINNVDFRSSIKAIGLLTAKARNNTRYAAVMFATHAQVVSSFTTPEEFIKRLKSVKRIRGATNNYEALKICGDLLRNSSSGLNPKALNRIVLITDGLFNINQLESIKEAFKLKLNNTDIFVIAVGRYQYGAPKISALASTQDSHVYRVKTMKGLLDIIQWKPFINQWEHLDKPPLEPLVKKQAAP